MAARKKTASKKAAAVVEEVESEEVATEESSSDEEPEAPAVEESAPAEVVAPTTKRGTPNNTWTLYYGNQKVDMVEGQERDFSLEVYNYLAKSGNLVARL